MHAAYQSGDPYLALAKVSGAIPPDGTKETHPYIREQYKTATLATQYGQGVDSLARRLGLARSEAGALLRDHRRAFQHFWAWSDNMLDHAMLHGELSTVLGWRLHLNPQNVNPRSLRNFPMQAHGSEILRLACCLATERDIHVCAPVHDALLIEAPTDEIEAKVAETQACMAEASRFILDGVELRSDATIIRYPERFEDKRGKQMWDTVWEILNETPRKSKALVHD